MLELVEPKDYSDSWSRWSAETLPMIPTTFKHRPVRTASKQLKVLMSLLKDRNVTSVVNACDAGREGEHIFRLVWQHSRNAVRQPNNPQLLRLWISSLTDGAIRGGMAKLRPLQHFDRLAAAAACRSEADWLVGLNATRALTVSARRNGGSELLTVGRVQTPTLALLARREAAIEAFVPETFWDVHARFDPEGPLATYNGTWRKGAQQHLKTAAEATAIADAVRGRPGVVERAERKRERARPPLLFDLTTLQKEANKRFGLSAERTLAAAQALYERHKAITYPRTDSRHLTGDMAPGLPKVVDRLAASTLPFAPVAADVARRGVKPGRRIIDDSQVGDHHAIIPTGRMPSVQGRNLEGRNFEGTEARIYELIARRFLAAFLPDAVYAATRITTAVADHRFVSSGRVRLEEGWHAAEPPPPPKKGQPAPAELPAVEQGDRVRTVTATVKEGQTQPPKRYTEGTLLGAMERPERALESANRAQLDEEVLRAMKASGLGTPATRASIIERLIRRGFVERQRKLLIATRRGRALITALPVDELASAELTGAWEARLTEIADGQGDPRAFQRDIEAFTRHTVAAIAAAAPPPAEAVQGEPAGQCPLCGGVVRHGHRGWGCSAAPKCTLRIPNRIAGRTMSDALVKLLLSGKTSKPLKGFKSKKGKMFSAALVLAEDGSVKMDFGFDLRSGRGTTSRARPERASPKSPKSPNTPSTPKTPKTPKTPAGPPRCPKCKQGRIIEGRRGWGCERWRDGCDFVVWYVHNGLRVPADEADRLFRRGETRLMKGLVHDGRARLVLDPDSAGNVRVVRAAKRSRRTPAKPGPRKPRTRKKRE